VLAYNATYLLTALLLQALSEFADYVEKQQALRYPSASTTAVASSSSSATAVEDHAEYVTCVLNVSGALRH
jgi:hypothetical protein